MNDTVEFVVVKTRTYVGFKDILRDQPHYGITGTLKGKYVLLSSVGAKDR